MKNIMPTQEKINANYLLFIEYLEKYDCYSEEMIKEIGDKIKMAPYSKEVGFGGAEPGSLIDVTLYKLCKIGAQINANVLGKNGGDTISHPNLCVNQYMLMRVLLLMNIAKAEIFEPVTEDWKTRRGIMYDFVEMKTKMKLGQRSLYLCQKYGIKLSEEEFDAFSTIDISDETGERFLSPLYAVVKTAKMLTLIELRQEYLKTVEQNKFEQEK